MRGPRRARLIRRLAALGLAGGLTVGLAQTATTAAFTAQTGDTGNQVSTAATFCASPGNTTLGPSSDTAVYQANPNQNYGATTGIGIGTGAGVNGFSLLKFSLPALPARCQITSATLTVRANSPTAGATLNAYRASVAWNAGTVTWNTGRPGFTGTPAQTSSLGSAGLQQWDVTALTRELYAGPDYGFLVKDSVDDSATVRYQTWDSMEVGTPANRPTLALTWG